MKKSRKKNMTKGLGTIATLAAGAAGVALLTRSLSSRYELQNKTVLITGGSRGLGLVMAREFGRRGALLAFAPAIQQNWGELPPTCARTGAP